MATNLIPLSNILPLPHHVDGIALITLSTDQLAQSPKDPLLDARTEPPCYVACISFLSPVTKVLHGPLTATFTCQKYNIGLWSVKSSTIRHESPLQSLNQTGRASHVTLIDLVSSVLLRMMGNAKNAG
ncbi:hypothetical protein SNK03_011111 [Fusarium graminearum]